MTREGGKTHLLPQKKHCPGDLHHIGLVSSYTAYCPGVPNVYKGQVGNDDGDWVKHEAVGTTLLIFPPRQGGGLHGHKTCP